MISYGSRYASHLTQSRTFTLQEQLHTIKFLGKYIYICIPFQEFLVRASGVVEPSICGNPDPLKKNLDQFVIIIGSL